MSNNRSISQQLDDADAAPAPRPLIRSLNVTYVGPDGERTNNDPLDRNFSAVERITHLLAFEQDQATQGLYPDIHAAAQAVQAAQAQATLGVQQAAQATQEDKEDKEYGPRKNR